MAHYDVFNGDADGICALQQLRLAQPRAAHMVTGVKRDIALLQRVPAEAGATVTVLDVSLHRNRAALVELLGRGVAVEYFDHHYAGDVPVHPLLRAHLDADARTCTSLLVDRHLQGRHRAWAIAGAFGDNLPEVAQALAQALRLPTGQVELLRTLGEAINYNAYGDSEQDLLLPPAELAALVRPYAEPQAFAATEPVARALVARQAQDLALGLALPPSHTLAGATVYTLPDTAWARRVQGVLANALSQRSPSLAHAVLRARGDQAWVVSLRAPRQRPCGADTLCLRFAGGGGRAASAGIDLLPRTSLEEFIAALARVFPLPAEAGTKEPE